MTFASRSPQQGAGIIAILVASAIIGLIAYYASQMVTSAYRLQRHMEIRSDMLELRNLVNTKLDCNGTVNPRPAACGSNSQMALKKADGTDLIVFNSGGLTAGYTKLGKYSLRASCVDCPTCPNGKRLLVESAWFEGSAAKKDPLNGKPLDFTDLFDDIPIACVIPP